ncbi:MAG TPA: hypothetical protein VLH15_06315 [Dehalococcoidales bacterium]|nr:hypothetical protein [Dehalococcoidales bacterium]
MNKILSHIAPHFGKKDLSHYPELYGKNNMELDYFLTLNSYAVFHDMGEGRRSPNWKVF